jgi:hypothetical protein
MAQDVIDVIERLVDCALVATLPASDPHPFRRRGRPDAESMSTVFRTRGAVMKRIYDQIRAFAGALVLATFTVWAPAYALQDFDACLFGAMEGSAGTVESVREVRLARDLHSFDTDALQHSVRPEVAEELIVRLDVGPVVVFTRRERHRLRSGQRVRVYLNKSIARVDRELAYCSIVGGVDRAVIGQ